MKKVQTMWNKGVLTSYQTPDMVVWSVEAEQGFAVSNPDADAGDLPGLDEDSSWS